MKSLKDKPIKLVIGRTNEKGNRKNWGWHDLRFIYSYPERSLESIKHKRIF